MFNKYFGNYILSRNIITSEQLKKVLEEQSEGRVKLGVLAIESGYMSAFQVTRVHKLQAIRDKRFGEIAVQEGFLTESQLMELLSKQKESHVMLGQILVDENMLSYEAYEKLLGEYKKDSGFSDDEIEILRRNNTDEIIGLMIKMDKNEHVSMFQEYVELFIRNLVRFIDRDVIIQTPYLAEDYNYKFLGSQEIVGANSIFTGLSGDEAVIVEFATIYAQETISTVDEMAKDAIGEFMNCQNGLFISNLYHKNIHYDLKPQAFDSEGSIHQQQNLFVLPCDLSFGKLDIIFNV